MGNAYGALLADRNELLLQLQAYAACGDERVQTVVRRRYAELYRYVEEHGGATAEEVRQFFALGMLLNVAAALDLPGLAVDEGWAARCLAISPGPDAR